jgi:hypothetical protein
MDDSKKKKGIDLLSPLSAYSRAIQVMGMENVHDAIAQGGIDVLRHGVPYLVVAARWQKARKYKKQSGHEQLTNNTEDIVDPGDIWNPYLQVERNQTMRILTDALAELPDHDILAVWGRMEGLTDKEIRDKWIELKIGPQNPTLSLIRKRRERALKKLRSVLKKRLVDYDDI